MAALCMATLMLLISIPYQPVFASIISTEEMLESARVDDAREYVNHVLARHDVEQELITQGLDPVEVQARVDSLSNAEIVRLAGDMENLPAGQGAFGTVVGAAVLIFLVLLVTDILGYTDVFPFVTSKGI